MARPRGLRARLLASVALAAPLLLALPGVAPAQVVIGAAGGAGGTGDDGNGGAGGASGTGGATGLSGSAGSGPGAGAGGAGGSPDGGSGSNGIRGGGGGGGSSNIVPGDITAATNGGNGGTGSVSSPGGGGGGGGGGDGADISATVPVTVNAAVSGGNGGNGGTGGAVGPNNGGAGGGGGAGVVLQGGGGLTVNAAVTGGNGGAAGQGTDLGRRGGGGGGGAGVILQNGGSLNVNARIIGGNGGALVAGGDGGTAVVLGATGTVTIAVGATVNGGNATGIGTGSGGAGVALLAGGTVVNAGAISGGTGGGDASTLVVSTGGTGSGGAAGGASGPRVGINGAGITGAGVTVINSGSIGGTQAITFTGGVNRLELWAGSTITGIVDATAGTSSTLALGGVTNSTFDVSQIGAQYRGFQTFEKTGASTWTLTGTSTFAGPVNVNAGTLSVNGDLSSASSLTVNAGGTLGGNGIVGATQINAGGALAPGNSIGLLTVQGNLAFMPGSNYLVEVSPVNADRTNVIGTATLGGAAVNASFAPGSYVAKQYTILNATSVSGTFNGLVSTNLPSGFTASLSYDPNNAFLELALFVPPAGPGQYSGLNVNQQNVATALTNFFNSTGGIPLAFGALTPAGLTQVSGEVATGAQQTTFDAMNLFLGLLTDPFVAGRGAPVGGAGAPAFADDADDTARAYAGRRPRTASERDAYAALYRKAPLAPVDERRWSVWAAGFGGTQTTDGNATLGSNTATNRIAQAAVGADYWFSPHTVAGFALAGGGTNFSVANSGTGRSDLFQAGAFVRHNVGPAYVTAALAYGWQDLTTDRNIGADHLQARFNANSYSGRIESGYRFVAGGIGLTPYAAAQFTTIDLPAYAEQAISGTNTFALNYASKSVTATRSELGLRADKSFALADSILTLRGRAAWAHNFDPDRSIAATFQALPGASFVVNGAAQAHDAALTTVSAEMTYANGVSLAATFEGEFSGVTDSYAGKGIVRYAW